MTDEELGRKWCQVYGKRPLVSERGAILFGPLDDKPYCLPPVLNGVLIHEWPQPHYFATDSEAYSAIGSALRRVLAFADGVREVLK